MTRCCNGLAARTPQVSFNRTGLPSISYRIGAYGDFFASLMAGLTSADRPALAALRTRDADDFTVALCDAFACAADVLTFYQERIVNESYLRTATERVSLQEMGKLIGYRLRPGLAAETGLSFALEAPRAAPASAPGAAANPGSFVTGIPAALTLPVGVKVQSVPGPGEQPQTFETVEPLEARPAWNAVQPWLSQVRLPVHGDTDTWLQGVRTGLKPGDALLFVGPEFDSHPTTDNHWDFRLLDAVEPDPAYDRTHVRWGRPLGSLAPYSNPSAAPRVVALRRRAAVFGHNAPMWLAMNATFRSDYPGGSAEKTVTQWPGFTLSPADHAATASGGWVDLDAVQAAALPGGYAVLAKGEFNRPDEGFPAGTYVELYQVTGAAEVSRAEFALSGKVTRLALRGQNLDTQFYKCVRETSVYVQSEALDFARYPVDDLVAGDQLPLAIAADGLLPGRRLIVNGSAVDGTAVAHAATLQAIAPATDGAWLTIAPPLPQALLRASVVVHANVAWASHGETVSQILGAGDASQAFQRFELKRLPLTWRGAANEAGAAAELTLRVGDIAWSERDTLFGAARSDRGYTLGTDEQGRLWAQFGDGVHGARLPSGVNNVRASYRQGLGQDGNVQANQLTQLLSRPLGLKSVANPLPALGGTDPEPAAWARRSMPLGTRTLGRAVSLLDYEDFAMAFTGIAKAQAQVLQLGTQRTVVVTVAGQDGAAVPADSPVWTHLLAALQAAGDPHVPLRLLGYQASTFRLGLKVRRDPAYAIETVLAAVEAALRAHFAFEPRALAQPVYESDVIAVAQAVPGVVAIDLDLLWGGTQPAVQAQPSRQARLLAARMRVAGGNALPAELLTLDAAPFDLLIEMP
jgi:hypothetical protein